MKHKLVTLVLAIAIIVSLVIAGCAKPAPPAPTPTPAPSPAPAPAPAPVPPPETAADFYKGKTVKFIVPYGPGGSNDVLSRLISGYLEPKIGANTIVESMPAAATIVAHNYMYNTAKPDGLTICLTNWAHLAGSWLTDEEAADWEPMEYEYLGAIQRLESVFMVKTDGPYNSIEDLQKAKDLKFATTTPAGSAGVSGSIVAEILGLDAKLIAGYPGSQALLLAVIQGEVDGCAFPSDSAYLYAQEGLVKPLFIVNYMEYEPWDVATLAELVQLSEDDRKLLDLQVLAIKPWIAPPGTPEDRVEFLGDMLYECAQDEGLIKTVTRLYGFWGGALTAEEAQSMFAVAASPENKAAFQEVLQPLIDKYAA